MTLRSIALHATILTLVLALAWWTRAGARDEAADAAAEVDEPTLVDAAVGDVERLAYVDARGDVAKTVTLEARRDDRGRWFYGVRESAGDEAEATREVFRGGASVERLWEHLEPLRARRAFGEVDDATRAEMGLEEPKQTLEITARGRTRRLELGAQLFGSQHVYARAADGRVVALSSAVVKDLQSGGERLVGKELLGVDRGHIVEAALAVGGQTSTVVQRDGRDARQASWAPAGEGEAPSAEWKSWMDKLLRLRATAWLEGAADPGWEPALTVTVTDDQGASEAWRLYRVAGEDGATAWRVVSDHGRLVAEVAAARAEELVVDLDGLLPGPG